MIKTLYEQIVVDALTNKYEAYGVEDIRADFTTGWDDLIEIEHASDLVAKLTIASARIDDVANQIIIFLMIEKFWCTQPDTRISLSTFNASNSNYEYF